jgi:hypothetical protein
MKVSKYAVVKSLVLLQAIGAATISFMHIVEVGQRYGLGWQSWIAPFLIDGFAILGTLGRGKEFSAASRKAGLKMVVGAGMVSLVCNVMAGENQIQKGFGVLVVAGFVAAEWYASKLGKAPAVVLADADAAGKARRREIALRAAATRKANAAAKARETKQAARTAKHGRTLQVVDSAAV